MKNKGVFGSDLARKSGGFICELIGHLQGWFCHVFRLAECQIRKYRGGMGLRMTHPQQRVVKPLPFLMYSIISYLEQKIICLP